MSSKGFNSENVKVNNRASVLQMLFANGPLSRSEIAHNMKLTPATVTAICNELLEKDLVTQYENMDEVSKVGRKKLPIGIRYNSRYILAINLQTNICYIAISNLQGKLVDQTTLPISCELSETPEELLIQISNASLKLLWHNGLQEERILGVGVSIIGPVNHIDGISINAFCLWRTPFQVKKILEKELRMPVVVESNVCAYMKAELLYNSTILKENILAVKWGPGVGSCSVINGKIFKGRGFQSAEIGHNFVNRLGKKCRCGKVGCLETQVSADTICEKIRSIMKEDPQSPLHHTAHIYGAPTRDTILFFLENQDPEFKTFLYDTTYELAVVVNNAIQILAPEQLLLYGDIFDSQSVLESFVDIVLSINDTLTKDMFVLSSYSEEKHYIGAVASAVQRLLVDTGAIDL